MENNVFKIEIDNSAGVATIDIEGTIGVCESCQFGENDARVATYDKFRSKVADINALNVRKVIVNIRSTGGDVNDAILIYDAIKSLSSKVETRCYGYTASAATIIAQAASEGLRKMSANSLYLIHRSSCSVEGNATEIASRLELLQKTDERIATIYSQASGRPIEEYVALMGANDGKGKWLSASEAKEAGLIDEILTAVNIKDDINVEELGLPELPKNIKTMEKEKESVGARFLSWLGISDNAEVKDFEERIAAKEVEVQDVTNERDALKVANEALQADVDTKNKRIEELEIEVKNLKDTIAEAEAMKVKATTTAQQVQDPAPQPAEPQKTANELAYEADLASFKNQ